VNYVQEIDDRVPVRRVLVSVFDKAGLEAFVPALLAACPQVKLYSTGGTYKALEGLLGAAARERLVSVSDYTGQPEMQGGLVKTLDFKIYLGLLGETYNEAHRQDLQRTGAVAFDLVVVNLYPFAQVTSRPEATPEQARANIDIGGPCMVRAAAKNFIRVASVVDPADYGPVAAELQRAGGALSLATRFHLAQKAFAYTARYDQGIAAYLGERGLAQVEACYPKLHRTEAHQ
jgi:phosphoribosylaminoimidazolecarboxamide formyltransferase/IMP cyclohydrolase